MVFPAAAFAHIPCKLQALVPGPRPQILFLPPVFHSHLSTFLGTQHPQTPVPKPFSVPTHLTNPHFPPPRTPLQCTHSTTVCGADYLPIRSWHHVLPQAIPPCPREGLVPSWRLRRDCSPPPPQVLLAHSGCNSLEPADIHSVPSGPQFPPCVPISAGLSTACTGPPHASKSAPVPMLRAAHRQVPEPHAEA